MTGRPIEDAAQETGDQSDMPRRRIEAAFERNARVLAARPGVGQGTAVTRARVTEADGLACEVTEGSWAITVDLSEKVGGRGLGPNPGMLGRSALASCLAIGYAMWAARLGVILTSIDVEVQAEYDTRGLFGVGEVEPGYREIRYVVTVKSEAPETAIRRVLDEADSHSPYHAVFSRPHELRRELRIERAAR
jgi:uncharacterized OsmC-like protein